MLFRAVFSEVFQNQSYSGAALNQTSEPEAHEQSTLLCLIIDVKGPNHISEYRLIGRPIHIQDLTLKSFPS